MSPLENVHRRDGSDRGYDLFVTIFIRDEGGLPLMVGTWYWLRLSPVLVSPSSQTTCEQVDRRPGGPVREAINHQSGSRRA
jgi:hypothetical protein